jgi:hypothetical protein
MEIEANPAGREPDMAIYEHITEFAGQSVTDWKPGDPISDPEGTAYRLMVDWDEAEAGVEWKEKLDAFLSNPVSQEVTGLVIGPWGEVATGEADAGSVVEALLGASERLPRLRSLFLGDITSEEAEISWIMQTNVSPLFRAFPHLEHFAVRGGTDLMFGRFHHDGLRTLIVQTGGLPREVVADVLSAHLPEMRHLELWFGDGGYGGDATVSDLHPLLTGEQFLQLEYLGLRNSTFSDEIAIAITASPLLQRIRTLDLSLGTLSDVGADDLLSCPEVRGLEKLDLHHHYCSEERVERLERLPIEVDASDPQKSDDGDDDRYVAVSE